MSKICKVEVNGQTFSASRGDMLLDAGKKQDAITQYKLVLKYLPGDQHATEQLQKLGVKPSAETSSNPHSSAPTTSGK